MAFQAGTNRDGFKAALMKAFTSAHRGGTSGVRGTVPNDKMTAFNPDRRAPGLMPGGPQAFRFGNKGTPQTRTTESRLGGGSHSSPAMTAKGPVNHNNDPRRTGLMTDGHQAKRIGLTSGSATNPHKQTEAGRASAKIKMSKLQNVDARGLRNR